MLESNMAAILESKMAAISAFISTLSWLLKWVGILSHCYFARGHEKHFPVIIHRGFKHCIMLVTDGGHIGIQNSCNFSFISAYLGFQDGMEPDFSI